MSKVELTVTQELQHALHVLEHDDLRLAVRHAEHFPKAREALDAAKLDIERALNLIQHARCDAIANLDRL